MTHSIFADLKVLDLSTVLAGPSVATFFAELGAQVVKIENPNTQGDVTRSWKLSFESSESNVSAYFASVNYNKKYVWLDIGIQRSELDDHIRWADVIIANFKHDDYTKFNLHESAVFALNDKVIYARIKGFDSDVNRIAYDSVLQAETGFMHMNGTPESGPIKMPVALIDILAAHQLKEGILCALLQKEKTGKGSLVDCSLERAGLSSLVNQASNFLMTGQVAQPIGSLHPNIAPYGETFVCSDGKRIVLAVGSDSQFNMLCNILGDSSIARHAHFVSNQLRVKNRKQLFELLQKLFMLNNRDEWMQQFIARNVPAGAIKDMREVMENTIANGMVLEEEVDGIQTKRMSSVAFTLSEL